MKSCQQYRVLPRYLCFNFLQLDIEGKSPSPSTRSQKAFMNRFSILTLSIFFATGAFAASHTSTATPEAQRSTNPKAEAAAEAKHKAKIHGIDKSATQPEAQRQSNPRSEVAAEAKHNAKSHGLNAVRTIPLENGSTVYIFKDGKMGMEDKMGRSTRMKPGHVMKAMDGTALTMVGGEVMRVESLLQEKKGGGN